jgi:hypothetical protein
VARDPRHETEALIAGYFFAIGAASVLALVIRVVLSFFLDGCPPLAV